RPILFKQDHGIRNFSTVMGGKIDNIYDVLEMIVKAKESLGLKRNVWRYLFPEGKGPG
ncbi:MAG: amino acid oxidase, partial [Gemmatimonadota bacterium]|nr:amino acid oxidase [Gemmatimonadota bacterium]